MFVSLKQSIAEVHAFLKKLEGLRTIPTHSPHIILRGWHVLKISGKYKRYHLAIEEIPKLGGDLIKYEIEDRSVDMRYVWQARFRRERVEQLRNKFGVRLIDFEDIMLWCKSEDPLSIATDLVADIKKFPFREDQLENMDVGDMARRIEQEKKRHHRYPHKLKQVMELIYQEFENKRAVPAREFDHLYSTFSKPLITRAKKTMLIESVRKDGIWYWAHPLHSPQPALDKMFRQRQAEAIDALRPASDWRLRALERPSVIMMREVMDENGYCPLAETVYEEMGEYSRAAILKAKQALGVMSYKHEGHMHWVWPAPHIKTYLLNILNDGPVPVTQVFEKYGMLVMRATKRTMPGITSVIRHNALCWISDVSNIVSAEETSEPVVEAKKIIERLPSGVKIEFLQ